MTSMGANTIFEQITSLNKGSFEMPAGTGKTQQIAVCANRLISANFKILVLTHTNAGVTALQKRFHSVDVDPSKYRITTICSWAERLVRSYPTTAGFDQSSNREDSDYYDNCVRCATTLLKIPFCAELISRSFDVLIVDEYQDCNKDKHEFVLALSALLAKTFVFGDRLQCIYDFTGEVFPDWKNDVQACFPTMETGEIKPYRWLGHNEALGYWLLEEARPALLKGCDSTFLLKAQCIDFVQTKKTNLTTQQINLGYHLISRPGSSLILGNSSVRKKRTNLAKRFKGKFDNLEDVEGRDLYKSVNQFIDASTENNHALWLAGFAKECFSGLGTKALDQTVMGGLERKGNLEKYRLSRPAFSDALHALQDYMDMPTALSFHQACFEIEGSSAGILCLSEQWESTTQAILASLKKATDPMDELTRIREAAKYRKHISGNHIGSTLLVKGLEYDNVLVLDAGDCKNEKDLYVAITRPRTFLQIIQAY